MKECMHGLKWSSYNKRKKQYPNVDYNLKIKIQDWILKHPSGIISLITNDIIWLQGEERVK